MQPIRTENYQLSTLFFHLPNNNFPTRFFFTTFTNTAIIIEYYIGTFKLFDIKVLTYPKNINQSFTMYDKHANSVNIKTATSLRDHNNMFLGLADWKKCVDR